MPAEVKMRKRGRLPGWTGRDRQLHELGEALAGANRDKYVLGRRVSELEGRVAELESQLHAAHRAYDALLADLDAFRDELFERDLTLTGVVAPMAGGEVLDVGAMASSDRTRVERLARRRLR